MNNWIQRVAGAALAIAVVGGGFAPWPIASDALRRDIAAQTSALLGMRVEAQGRAVFSLLPFPRVKIEGFRAAGANGAVAIDAASLTGEARVLPLLGGRLELAGATLIAPKIVVDIDAALAAGAPTMAGSFDLAISRRGLSFVEIVDGELLLRRESTGLNERISNVNAAVDFGGSASPTTARGNAVWRGEAARAALWIGASAEGRTPVVASLQSPAASASLDGDVMADAFEGVARLQAASIAAVARLGGGFPGLEEIGGFTFSSPARITAKTIDFPGARVDFAGSRYNGALTFTLGAGRPKVSGTLAADSVDLTAFAALAPPLRDPAGGWSAAPLPRAALDAIDIDLRVSAAKANVGSFKASGVGLSVLAAGGKLEASLAEASAYGGVFGGRATARQAGAGISTQVEGRVSNLDLGAALKAAGWPRRFLGTLSADLALDGEGVAIADIVAGLRGDAHLNLVDGDIDGLDIEGALRRVERRPATVLSDLRGGKTPVDIASASSVFDKGIARVETARAAGPGARVDVSGSASLSSRRLSLRLLASAPSASPAAEAPGLGFGIAGPWDAPALTLDTPAPTGRSPAADPAAETGGAVQTRPPAGAALANP